LVNSHGHCTVSFVVLFASSGLSGKLGSTSSVQAFLASKNEVAEAIQAKKKGHCALLSAFAYQNNANYDRRH
jgi:hypothetical protein